MTQDGSADATDTVEDVRPCGVGPGDVYQACYQSIRIEHYQSSPDRDPEWTLCDEDTHTCTGKPTAQCHHGWCQIPKGSFLAGGDLDGAPSDSDWSWYPAVITRSFEIQQTEVTQGRWLTVMGLTEPDNPANQRSKLCGPDCPIQGMTFFDVLTFANRLSDDAGLERCYTLVNCNGFRPGIGKLVCEEARYKGQACQGYRLPTDAEWDLAASASANTCTAAGSLKEPLGATPGFRPDKRLNRVAWYNANSDADYLHEPGAECENRAEPCLWIHPVAAKKANPFGLYDTSGNVEEMTWGAYYHGTDRELKVDPGHLPVIRAHDLIPRRGGKYISPDIFVCTRHRDGMPANCHLDDPNLPEDCQQYSYWPVGFRLVRTLPE